MPLGQGRTSFRPQGWNSVLPGLRSPARHGACGGTQETSGGLRSGALGMEWPRGCVAVGTCQARRVDPGGAGSHGERPQKAGVVTAGRSRWGWSRSQELLTSQERRGTTSPGQPGVRTFTARCRLASDCGSPQGDPVTPGPRGGRPAQWAYNFTSSQLLLRVVSEPGVSGTGSPRPPAAPSPPVWADPPRAACRTHGTTPPRSRFLRVQPGVTGCTEGAAAARFLTHAWAPVSPQGCVVTSVGSACETTPGRWCACGGRRPHRTRVVFPGADDPLSIFALAEFSLSSRLNQPPTHQRPRLKRGGCPGAPRRSLHLPHPGGAQGRTPDRPGPHPEAPLPPPRVGLPRPALPLPQLPLLLKENVLHRFPRTGRWQVCGLTTPPVDTPEGPAWGGVQTKAWLALPRVLSLVPASPRPRCLGLCGVTLTSVLRHARFSSGSFQGLLFVRCSDRS